MLPASQARFDVRTSQGPLLALYYLPNICDGILLFIFGSRNSLFLCYLNFFLEKNFFCAVTNNELNAITCSVSKRKIH